MDEQDDVAEHYDVVCVGGALIGSSCAYFLGEHPDFDGSVLVVEPDSTYADAQSSRSGNSIREQFSHPLNIAISQFAMEFVERFVDNVQVDGEAPALGFRGTGYLFVARDDRHMDTLRADCATQLAAGADVRLLSADDIGRTFPYMSTDGLVGGRFGSPREGSLDGWALLQGFRRRAVHRGARYLDDRVIGFDRSSGRITAVRLASGRRVACGHVVNAAGTRASEIASLAGLRLPVEPRSRTTFMFDCRTAIDHNVPLTVTPEGVHFRREQRYYLTGGVPIDDRRVDPDDLAARDDEFVEIIWPVLASYVPEFDRVSVVTSWGGQYAYNPLDHNLIVGAGDAAPNLIFANGFSGHGLQQSPAVGRAVSELIVDGHYRSLDLSPFGFDRFERGELISENVVI